LVGLASWSQNLVACLPSLAGIGLGRNPDGIASELRRGWAPVARDRIAMTALACGLVVAWVLRLADVIDGWTFFGASLVVGLALRSFAARRQTRSTEPDVPVEWRGLRRAWRAEDREVLDRGIAGG
jgi:branched-chain amino acid transport system permease protein